MRRRGTDSARIITLIRTTGLKGNGVPEDPYRNVHQYWTLDGRFLFEEHVNEIDKSDHQQLEPLIRFQYMKP